MARRFTSGADPGIRSARRPGCARCGESRWAGTDDGAVKAVQEAGRPPRSGSRFGSRVAFGLVAQAHRKAPSPLARLALASTLLCTISALIPHEEDVPTDSVLPVVDVVLPTY